MRKRRSMAATAQNPNLNSQIATAKPPQQRVIDEEIDGLIRVYRDGHVERPPVVPCVAPSLASDLGVTCGDMIIDTYTNIWARIYVPNAARENQLPVLVYFHGGGFCLGSAAWSCYHEFLAKLVSRANCAVVSVNYRLAPENPLPAAYDDGVKALSWVARQVFVKSSRWWVSKCNTNNIFLCGDSAGANIAYNVAARVNKAVVGVKGLVLIQPFFGGEKRTCSEREAAAAPPRSALTVSASDVYWRLALPAGADRDHPWCNPGKAAGEGVAARGLSVLVCVSEMDVLRDRNLEFCGGRRVEQVVLKGVGHAFQILDKSALSEVRVHEMICRIKDFVAR